MTTKIKLSLLVGVSFAKSLAAVHAKPLVGVHHLAGVKVFLKHFVAALLQHAGAYLHRGHHAGGRLPRRMTGAGNADIVDPPPYAAVQAHVAAALAEDLGRGDVTAALLPSLPAQTRLA